MFSLSLWPTEEWAYFLSCIYNSSTWLHFLCLNLLITLSCPCPELHEETVFKGYPLTWWTNSNKRWVLWMLWAVRAQDQDWSCEPLWKEVGRFRGESEVGAIRGFIGRASMYLLFSCLFRHFNICIWACVDFFPYLYFICTSLSNIHQDMNGKDHQCIL